MADVRFCPWCGAEVEDDDARFCGVCGRPLDADSQVAGQATDPAAGDGGGAGSSQERAAGRADASHKAAGPTPPEPSVRATPSSTPSRTQPKAGRGRRPNAIIVASVAVIAVALVSIVLTVSSGGTGGTAAAGDDSAGASNGEAAQAEGTTDAASQDQGASGSAGASTNAAPANAAGDGSDGAAGATSGSDAGAEAAAASGSGDHQDGASAGGGSQAATQAQTDRDRVVASMDGWWTQVGGRPYNDYVYYHDGMVFSYSHDGQLEHSGPVDVSVERVGPPEFGEAGWKITSNDSDPSHFDVLDDAGDMLWLYWYDDYGKLQCSGTDSIWRCGDGHNDPLPSFAAAAQAAADQQAAAQAAPTGFEAEMPIITGWEQQPLQWGESGFIWRASWTPIEGAEGYEVIRWDLDQDWVRQDQTVTTTWYDCIASASLVFDVQVRAFKTENGQRVYTQWSPYAVKVTG